MNTTIAWVIGAVILLGGGYWFVSQRGAVAPSESSTQVAVQPASQEESTNDIESVMKRGGNYECTVSVAAGQGTSSGVVYVSGTNIRGDFSTTMAGKSMTSSMIQADGTVYTWTNMYPQGFKIKAVPNANPLAGASASGMNLPNGGTYTCKPWTLDSSKFVPPASVKFMEAPAMKR